MKSTYLDYAAATPLDAEVLRAMEPYFAEQFYNPSAIYLPAIKVRKALDQARAGIATCLGAHSSEIYFTAGATEANNLAIQGIMRQWPDGELLTSAIEHESVLVPARQFNHQLIPVTNQGIVDIAKLEALISPKTVLISVAMVNHELGVVQPIKEIAALLKRVREERRAAKGWPLYFHTDAAQAANLFDLQTHRLGVDLMSINGGKIYGPKQTGALFVGRDVRLAPLILGGGQERGLRSGTENVAGAVGLAKALEIAQKTHTQESARLNNMRLEFISQLTAQIPGVIINGSKKHTSPHILSVTFPGVDNERAMMQLDELGIQVATGSACSASSDEPSHVLSAIGLDKDAARSTLRFSFGRSSSPAELDRVVGQLKKILSVKG